jgi:hypothetical protein
VPRGVYVVPKSLGQTQLVLGGAGIVTAIADVTVVSPLPTQPVRVRVAPGFQTSAYVGFNGSSDSAVKTLRSLDPSRVRLSATADGASVDSLALPSNDSFYVRWLKGTTASGDVGLELSVAGFPTIISHWVESAPVEAAFSTNLRNVRILNLGQSADMFPLLIAGNSPQEYPPGEAPVAFVFETTPPGVLTVIPPQSAGFPTRIRGDAPGQATVSLRVAGNTLPVQSGSSLLVTVNPAPQFAPPFNVDLGKDCWRYVTLPFPATTGTTAASITTSAAGLVTLAKSEEAGSGSPTLQYSLPEGSRALTFRVIGLASQGEATVTLRVGGADSASFKVFLRPTGLAWNKSEVALMTGEQARVNVVTVAVDPVSRIPLEQQSLLSGIVVPISVQSSNTSIATATSQQESVIDAKLAGEANITIQQPPGFLTPAIRQSLKVSVTGPPPPSSSSYLVTISVTGNGSVTDGTYACGSPYCTRQVPAGTTITLKAARYATSRFQGWSGSCSGTGDCVMTVNSALTVAAAFADMPKNFSFVPMAPCRIVDTRLAQAGAPAVAAQIERTFTSDLFRTNCPNLAANAAAYSLNITVVPRSSLGYITVWPAGEERPLVSTLNSLDGRVKANAAIVGAGVNGGISAFATNETELIIDVNGYFVPSTQASSQRFYPITPCRVADTRLPAGPLGGPALAATATRSFPVLSSPCGIPASATAYALNVTSVTNKPLGYVTIWPDNGSPQPVVSTLNNLVGTIVANAAIVPAGSNGSVKVFASDATDLILDISGYFAPPGFPGALQFNLMSPCRVLDTRTAIGVLGGPIAQAGVERQYPLRLNTCGIPGTAEAYALNATVLPETTLGYLTVWPYGIAQPLVSTLNAIDGSLTSNALIVPSGTGGYISAFVTNRAHLILDAAGYFAP